MKLYYRATAKGLCRLLERAVRSRSTRPPFEPVAGRVLYLPASALPYHISGYTTRTLAVIRALSAAGADVRVLTRPGYPWDRKDRLGEPASLTTGLDGVLYEHARRPSKFMPLLLYAILASRVIEQAARDRRVGLVLAPSNHTNAIPALLAARRLGIPFYYEMRGLWELSRASRKPGFEKSPGYAHGLALEGFVAKNADRVLLISEQLKNYVAKHWDIPSAAMLLLPNCIDPAAIAPVNAQDAEPDSIGYAGSLVAYEGLDILIEAVDILASRGIRVQLSIIGDGEDRKKLEALVSRLGLDDHIRFWGHMSPQAARDQLGRCAIICLPRKPFKVCEIVPPIKLAEALAMAKPVIVADLPVLRDELGRENHGWLFKAGDPLSLADKIAEALRDPEALISMGQRAREYVTSQRNWAGFAQDIVASFNESAEPGI